MMILFGSAGFSGCCLRIPTSASQPVSWIGICSLLLSSVCRGSVPLGRSVLMDFASDCDAFWKISFPLLDFFVFSIILCHHYLMTMETVSYLKNFRLVLVSGSSVRSVTFSALVWWKKRMRLSVLWTIPLFLLISSGVNRYVPVGLYLSFLWYCLGWIVMFPLDCTSISF